MNIRSASWIAFSLLALGGVQAQVLTPTDTTSVPLLPAEPNPFTSQGQDSAENALVAVDGPPLVQQMQARLRNPVQRASLRAEQRAALLQSHEGVGRALDIDAATESTLIELLSDQRMEQLDMFFQHMASPPRDGESTIRAAASAGQKTRQAEALRELLGEQRLEQYQAFSRTLGERSQVRQLDARLDRADKLTPKQTEQLILLYQAHHEREMDAQRATTSWLPPIDSLDDEQLSPEGQRRQSLMMTIASNEDVWRRLPDQNRLLLKQAGAILTPPQLAMLSRIQTEHADQLRLNIEQRRMQAGLHPQIPTTEKPAR